jgi:hypothetical protein
MEWNTAPSKLETKISHQPHIKNKNLTETTPPSQERFSLKELTAEFQKFVSARATKEQTDTTTQTIIQTRFLEKIVRAIAQSCRLNAHEAQFFLPHPVSLQILVSLSHKGMIEKAFVSKTSGFFIVDQFILTQFYDAAHSFPRLPLSVTKIPYKILVQVDIPSGIDRPYYFKVLVE